MTYSVDAVVLGAGVVGLACAKKLAEQGLETLVIEAESSFGTGTSSRNSEVIHAGIYYTPNTYKAKLCIRGARKLYDYCAQRGVQHKKVGKWIVAQNPEQIKKLEAIKSNGEANGCDDLHYLSLNEIKKTEPALKASAALCSPCTGIIDSHGLMQSFIADVNNHGGIVVYKSKCISVQPKKNGFELTLNDEEQTKVFCRKLVNSCGLNSVDLLKTIEGFPKDLVPDVCFAKGNYFSYLGKVPFQRLIYPVPEVGGLGTHLTLDLNGQARFGPDVEWVDKINYQVNESSAQKFAHAIKAYWPECDAQKLAPAYAGIRPKLGTPNNFLTDFVIQGHRDHGLVGLVNLMGIESPGLTASLSIADEVFSIFQSVE
jgi:L-2-hydroxyglutarate oxidase LhgO